MKWEYKVCQFRPPYEDKMNALGSDGWELVSTMSFSMMGSTVNITMIFKRPLTG